MLPSRVHHFVVKLWEQLLRFHTFLRRPRDRDRTRILVEGMSAAQRRASHEANAGLSKSQNEPARVLVIIPYRDRYRMTRDCIRTLFHQRGLGRHQMMLCLVNHKSKRNVSFEGLSYSPELWRVRTIRDQGPFNFSRLNNRAVSHCSDFRPDLLFFLNNDVEMIGRDCLSRMIDFTLSHPSLGALGCTLLYPNNLLQHLFLAPGVKIAGAHPLRGMAYRPEDVWYQAPRPVPAVTGAALITRASAFQEVGGFDERLATAYQDLDYCLKLQQKGLVNWVLPDVTMIHHETMTRKQRFHMAELEVLYSRWGEFLTRNPFWSCRFSRWSESPVFTLGEGDYPWKRIARMLDKSNLG